MSNYVNTILKNYPKSIHLFGHDYIYDLFNNMIKNKSLHSGFIFSGVDGIGKATYAIDIIKKLMSHTIDDINNGNIDKLTFISDEVNDLVNSNTYSNFFCLTPKYDSKKKDFKNNISVDDIRELIDFLHITSSYDSYTCVLIDSLDNMGISACNALLKVLEEPPKNTMFILICHDYVNLLDTIKSRCLNIPFSRLSNDNIINIYKSLNINSDIDAITNALTLADGSVSKLLLILKDDNRKIIEALFSILSNEKTEFAVMKFISMLKSGNTMEISLILDLIYSYLSLNLKINKMYLYSQVLQDILYLKHNNNILNLDDIQLLHSILLKVIKL